MAKSKTSRESTAKIKYLKGEAEHMRSGLHRMHGVSPEKAARSYEALAKQEEKRRFELRKAARKKP